MYILDVYITCRANKTDEVIKKITAVGVFGCSNNTTGSFIAMLLSSGLYDSEIGIFAMDFAANRNSAATLATGVYGDLINSIAIDA